MFSARLRLFMYTPGWSFNNIPTEFMTLALFHLQHTTLKGNRRRVLILQDRFMPRIFHRPTLPPTVSMVIRVAIGCRRTWIAKIDPVMFGTMSILVYIPVFVLARLISNRKTPKRQGYNNARWRLYRDDGAHTACCCILDSAGLVMKVLEYQNKARAVSWSVLSVELNFRITSSWINSRIRFFFLQCCCCWV